MSDFSYLEDMSEYELSMFRKSIRKLLDTTFLVKAKDERLYQYVARESNRQNIADYLRMIGYDLDVNDELGVAMLKPFEIDDENNGLKRTNLITFDASQIKVLLVLWQTYLSKCGYEREVYITFGEVIDRLKYYEISADLKQKYFKDTMDLFKRFSLIQFPNKQFESDDRIRLYPSLQFCMDIDQLKQVIDDFIPNNQFMIEESQPVEEDDE